MQGKKKTTEEVLHHTRDFIKNNQIVCKNFNGNCRVCLKDKGKDKCSPEKEQKDQKQNLVLKILKKVLTKIRTTISLKYNYQK